MKSNGFQRRQTHDRNCIICNSGVPSFKVIFFYHNGGCIFQNRSYSWKTQKIRPYSRATLHKSTSNIFGNYFQMWYDLGNFCDSERTRMKYRRTPEVYTKEIAKICIKKVHVLNRNFDEKSVFFPQEWNAWEIDPHNLTFRMNIVSV